jgi:hypothetical protein
VSAQRAVVPVPDAVEPPAGPFDLPVDNTGMTLPRLRVLMPGGERFEVQAYNPDLIAYETTAARHRWPSLKEAPFTWLTFLAWSAARRGGHIDQSVTWDQFQSTALEVSNLTRDEDTAHPTRPAPVAG